MTIEHTLELKSEYRPAASPSNFLIIKSKIYEWDFIRNAVSAFKTSAPSITLYIVRHAETTYNARGLVCGSSDVALTSDGIIQARRLRGRLPAAPRLIYCSTLHRSQQTMQAVYHPSANFPRQVLLDSRLNERDLGVLEGKPKKFIPEFALGDLDFAPQGGESYRSVCQRCLSFLIDLRLTQPKCLTADAVVFCHMGPMRVFSGIFDALETPEMMMNVHFRNTHLLRYSLKDVRMPSFL